MKIKFLLIALAAMVLNGCHTHRITDGQYERLPLKVTKSPTKEGKACASYPFIIGLFYSNNDVTVEAARQNGNINEIVSIEREIHTTLFSTSACTVVRGN